MTIRRYEIPKYKQEIWPSLFPLSPSYHRQWVPMCEDPWSCFIHYPPRQRVRDLRLSPLKQYTCTIYTNIATKQHTQPKLHSTRPATNQATREIQIQRERKPAMAQTQPPITSYQTCSSASPLRKASRPVTYTDPV